MQPGDVPVTCADIERLRHDFGFAPATLLQTGLQRFTDWFLDWNARSESARRAP